MKAEDYYKNIQVLNGMPANQVIPTMEYMRSALGGVRCQYCHNAPPDFAGDDKPQKKMGRKMLQMVLDINKNTFGGSGAGDLLYLSSRVHRSGRRRP